MADPRPRGMPWLTSYLSVRDAKKSIAFYKKAFGFESTGVMKDKGKIMHVGMSYKKQTVLMFSPEGAGGDKMRTPKTLKAIASEAHYLYVDDVDATYAKAIKAGAKSVSKPEDAFWGDRHAAIDDIDGYRWSLARKLTTKRSSKK
jgi:uncharacterized glyoxalase superfamily protein PhnB